MSGTEPQADAEGIERRGYTQELRRTLSCTDLLVYGLIFMVPIAPFGIFGSVSQDSAAWLFTAASYAQRSQAFPLAEGDAAIR